MTYLQYYQQHRCRRYVKIVRETALTMDHNQRNLYSVMVTSMNTYLLHKTWNREYGHVLSLQEASRMTCVIATGHQSYHVINSGLRYKLNFAATIDVNKNIK